MPVNFVLFILGIAKPPLANQLLYGEAGITVLSIWKKHILCHLSAKVHEGLANKIIYSCIHSSIVSITWDPCLNTR